MRNQPLLPIYIADESRYKPPIELHSLDMPGKRYYYTFRSGQFRFYPSVTTLSSLLIPMGPHFIQWVAKMGHEAAKVYARERAHYGTIMHDICLYYLRKKHYVISSIRDYTQKYMEKHRVNPALYNEWVRELSRDFLAFMKWVEDYQVKLIAIEYPIASYRHKFAGRIDCICEITKRIKGKGYFGETYKRNGKGYKKGDPKLSVGYETINAIVDLKSGRKGFYDAHKFQLHAYQIAWNENFGKIMKIERVFNWAPKEWRNGPNYTLSEQTSDSWLRSVPLYAKLAKEQGFGEPNKRYWKVKDAVSTEDEVSNIVYSEDLKTQLRNGSTIEEEQERNIVSIG